MGDFMRSFVEYMESEHPDFVLDEGLKDMARKYALPIMAGAGLGAGLGGYSDEIRGAIGKGANAAGAAPIAAVQDAKQGVYDAAAKKSGLGKFGLGAALGGLAGLMGRKKMDGSK